MSCDELLRECLHNRGGLAEAGRRMVGLIVSVGGDVKSFRQLAAVSNQISDVASICADMIEGANSGAMSVPTGSAPPSMEELVRRQFPGHG